MIETKLNGTTSDIAEENIAKLKEIFPDVFCEGKIDFEKLQQVLGNYVEDAKERYIFSWNGKGKSLKLAQSPSTGTLLPCKEESKDWNTTENLYIEGDNLEVLKLLQKSYHNKIKMIYIDPPYNTGHDFVYKDNFKDNLQNYLEITGQTDEDGNKMTTNSESNGRYHTDWLNMMYPRLRLARNLLTDDGVIFISIGQAEIHNISKMCDEIYGEDNRISIISRVMKSGSAQGQYFSPNVEYIAVYAKNILELEAFREPISEEIIKKLYTSIENEGLRKGEKYRPFGLYQSSLDPMRGCSNQRYFIEAPDGTLLLPPGNVIPIDKRDGAMISPKTSDDKVWRWSRDRYLEEKSKGNITFKKSSGVLIDSEGNPAEWNVYTKIWLNDRQEDGMVPVDLITKWENRQSKKELQDINIPFDFAKPVSLIKYLISIVDNTSTSTILDFFSGSATTAHAVMQLNAEDGGNRKFICVQLPEPTDEKSEAFKAGYKNICEIGKERIRRAGEKIQNTFAQMTINMNDRELNDDEKPAKLMFNTVISKEPSISVQEFHTDSLDTGFKVFKLNSSNIKKWQPDFDEIADYISNMENNFVDNRTELDVVYEIMIKYGLDLTYPVEELSCGETTLYSIGMGMLIICLANNIGTDVAKFISDYKKENEIDGMRVVFADGCFGGNDSLKTNIKEILKVAGVEEFITI